MSFKLYMAEMTNGLGKTQANEVLKLLSYLLFFILFAVCQKIR